MELENKSQHQIQTQPVQDGYKLSGAAFEIIAAQNERTVRRLVAVLVLVIIMFFASNVAWLYALNRYDYKTETRIYSQGGQGNNIIDYGKEAGSSNPE